MFLIQYLTVEAIKIRKMSPPFPISRLLYFIFMLLCALISNYASSQTHINVSLYQPTELTIDAGSDTSIHEGESVQIGGNPTASGGYGSYAYYWTPIEYLIQFTDSNPTASPEETTTYVLTVRDNNNCIQIDTVMVSVVRTTGLEIFNKSIKFSVFPNPSEGVVYITLKGSYPSNIKIIVIDIQGKNIFKKNIDRLADESLLEFKFTGYPGGIYLIKFLSDDFSITKKIVLKR